MGRVCGGLRAAVAAVRYVWEATSCSGCSQAYFFLVFHAPRRLLQFCPFLPCCSEPPPDCVHGVETNVLTMSGDAGRFLARMAQVRGV